MQEGINVCFVDPAKISSLATILVCPARVKRRRTFQRSWAQVTPSCGAQRGLAGSSHRSAREIDSESRCVLYVRQCLYDGVFRLFSVSVGLPWSGRGKSRVGGGGRICRPEDVVLSPLTRGSTSKVEHKNLEIPPYQLWSARWTSWTVPRHKFNNKILTTTAQRCRLETEKK